MEVKEDILNLLGLVKREGMPALITYLKESDFFTAPCSTQFHLACEGGLAKHSLNVYDLLTEKVKRYSLGTPEDSIVICGLLHDLCKTNYYVRGKRIRL